MKPVSPRGRLNKRATETTDKLTPVSVNTPPEVRIPPDGGQLALGACPDGQNRCPRASGHRKGSVCKGHRRRGARSMGRYPFLTSANRLMRETHGYYAQSTCAERSRKLRRINDILAELRSAGKITTTSPKKMTEGDVEGFIAWCKRNLDDSTSAKYLRYLDDVLMSEGNGAVQKVKALRKGLIPKATMKSIQTIPESDLEVLLGGQYSLEDPLWDAVGKAALNLYLHTGLRSGELRGLRLCDLNLQRMEVRVSSPKGKGKWASGDEISPIMPGMELMMECYVERRAELIRNHGQNPSSVEPLFPYLNKHGEFQYWHQTAWNRLKQHIELVTEVRFKWKNLRPTFAQRAKDMGAPIEAVSKCMRHTSTRTTELYYARIRSESAFSQVRQCWKPLPEISIRQD